MRALPLILLAGVLAAVELVPTPALAAPPLDAGHAELAGVLAAVVRRDGVDYARLRAVRPALDRYRVQLAAATAPTARSEVLALWMNAYNALTLALVDRLLPADPAAWPVWSIRNGGSGARSVWQQHAFAVAGSTLTLDQIEHARLRPLGDPRIHLGINCASRSCPPLAVAPFTAAAVDAQLDHLAAAFAADPAQVRIAADAVEINPILVWFASDFAAAGGARGFLLRHLPATAAVARALAPGTPLRPFDYDWRLNLAGGAP